MSAASSFYSFCSEALKRPTTWILGVIGTVATGFATNLFTPVETYLSEKVSPYYCEYLLRSQKPISDELQFNILISRLTHDPWLSHRELVISAFHGAKGFHVIPICESLNFDYSKDLQTTEDETLHRAKEVIKARHADLLLFGEVRKPDDAVKIYAVNENGGCDLHPKPTIIEHGDLPGAFTDEQKKNLIIVSLQEIQSACLNQHSRDWPLFAKRMNKIEMFLKYLDFHQPNSLHFGASYIEATRLLYGNGQGDIWLSNGEKFAKRIIDQGQGNSKPLSRVYAEYAILLDTKFHKTKDKSEQDATFHAFDRRLIPLTQVRLYVVAGPV